MVTQRRIFRPGVAAMALGLVSVLALAGCAEESEAGSGSSGSGEGLELGATMEEYQQAFEDIDPIELQIQSPAPQGSTTGLPYERWAETVTEWSGGKITFEFAFSNAMAGPTEIDDALNDGRLDVASTLPIYEPDEYPAIAALIETGFISNQTPVLGSLQSNAWPNEVAFNNEDVMKEFEEHGLVPLVPIFNSGAQGMFCTEPRTSLDDFKGLKIRTQPAAASMDHRPGPVMARPTAAPISTRLYS
jgi:TRAP-type C4-dicarboxylate transport system substrate-binding protein